jgi:hypothetical protein
MTRKYEPFSLRSTERARFAQELQAGAQRLGKSDPERKGSVAGAVHRTWSSASIMIVSKEHSAGRHRVFRVMYILNILIVTLQPFFVFSLQNSDGHRTEGRLLRSHDAQEVDAAINSFHVMSLKMAGEHASKKKIPHDVRTPDLPRDDPLDADQRELVVRYHFFNNSFQFSTNVSGMAVVSPKLFTTKCWPSELTS